MTRYLRSIRSGAAAAVLIGSSLMTGLAGTAEASHVACGDLITASITLDADVGPCLGVLDGGLVISGASAPAIVIDLNGFRLFGDSDPVNFGSCGIAIENSSNVTVKDGTIEGFDVGVCIGGGSGNTIDSLTLLGNYEIFGTPPGAGIQVVGSSSNTITGNTVRGNGFSSGIVLSGNADSNTVDGNVVTSNIRAGIFLQPDGRGDAAGGGDPDSNSITNNTLLGNGAYGILIGTQRWDAAVGDFASGNVIEGNLVEGHALGGIVVGSTVGELVQESVPGVGPYSPEPPAVQPDGNTVKSNTVCANPGNGIGVYSIGNTITLNRAGDGAMKPAGSLVPGPCLPNGPALGDLYDDTAGCGTNTWTTNSFTTKNRSCIA